LHKATKFLSYKQTTSSEAIVTCAMTMLTDVPLPARHISLSVSGFVSMDYGTRDLKDFFRKKAKQGDTCDQCKRQVEDMSEHLDWHVAMNLYKEERGQKRPLATTETSEKKRPLKFFKAYS
jgi:hypothetical protein